MPLPEPFARGLRRIGWLAGLPALALIWAGATRHAAPEVAARLMEAGAPVAAGTATATGEPWLRLSVRGRDLVAAGEAPDVGERETVLTQLAALDGPRRIVSEVGLVETAAPFLWSAIRTGPASVLLEGSRPVEVGRRALEVYVTGSLGPGTRLDDAARAARGAPPDFPGAASYLAARLTALTKGGRAALSDTVLSLSGEALDVPAYDALRAALREPPAGFSVGRVEILPPLVSDDRFVLERSGGGIILDGYVASEALRDTARRLVSEAADGGFVDDRLHTARGLDPAIDPDALVAFAARFAALIQSGTVTFSGGALSVTGDAIDAQAIPEAAALMRDRRPAGVKAGPVTLAAKPLSPYRMAIRRTPEGVTLTGHLPDAGVRERVLAALRPRLFREPVIDRTRLADGAPADLGPALEAAVPMLASLATGEIAVSDRALGLSGESLYRESAERAADRLAAVLPSGWSGRAAVAQRQPAERRDLDACREGFSAATASADLRFPVGGVTLTPSFYPTLDALAALARTCPSLRIAVSGPADPARPKAPPDKPAVEAKPAPTRTAGAGKPEGAARPVAARAAAKDAVEAKPDAKTGAALKKEAPEEPPPDLARLRALALVEYLLQAGARPEQVAAGPDGPGGRVAFVIRP